MTMKKQFQTIKDNWLMLLLVLVLLFVFTFGNSFTSGIAYSSKQMLGGMDYVAVESLAYDSRGGYYPTPGGGDFAPDVEERKIIKTSSLSTEVERGEFKTSETKLKNIITSSDSFLLNENVNLYGRDRTSYYRGSYQLKVDTDKYDSVVSQLKEIGEVTSFNENANDVTGQYVSLEDQLELEKDRLSRYEDMLDDSTRIEDKINLNDRIFNQERTIKYYQDRINNLDTRIDYTTISFSINEKQSEYVSVAVVKFSELIKSLVGSFNFLLRFAFIILPWLILFLVYRGIRTYIENR